MQEHKLNILSAEDDPDDQLLIEKAVKESGINADINFVSDGKSLLDKLTEQYGDNLPDILLLDLNMPIMDGLEVLRVLRERDDLDDLPVIILTTSSDQNDIDKCNYLGIKTFITKPASFTEYIEIARCLPEYKV